MSDVASVQKAVVEGDARKAASELLPLVYEELRRLAAHKLANEAPGQTLQPTALVHEAWLRLVRPDSQHFDNRGHFFAAAAEAMRRILIDRARRKAAQRHGGGLERVDLELIDLPEKASDDLLLRVDAALESLSSEDARAAELIKLRFFAGLTMEQAAQALGITDRTARRDWRFARAWLHNVLKASHS
jgi:RNA polymerase sigma factor (TIGR02999 family)